MAGGETVRSVSNRFDMNDICMTPKRTAKSFSGESRTTYAPDPDRPADNHDKHGQEDENPDWYVRDMTGVEKPIRGVHARA